jgi:hypothetical protein
MLLAELARRLTVRAIVTVRVSEGSALARVFLPESSAFDAVTYTPDNAHAWSSAARSLALVYGPGSAHPSGAPVLATRPAPHNERPTPAFYQSVWFWGALGAAVLIGGAFYLASRDTSPNTIHLELQVH